MSGYIKTYTRNSYSRGAMRKRDMFLEGFSAPKCIICGNSIERNIRRNGSPEAIGKWIKRKTCGLYWDEKENGYKKTPCLCEYIKGSGNPNYKGICDISCIDCGKKNLAYVKADKVKTKRCWDCRILYMSSEEYISLYLPNTKGHVTSEETKRKISLAVRRDRKCSLCNNKHVAKGLCSKHYQSQNKLHEQPELIV